MKPNVLTDFGTIPYLIFPPAPLESKGIVVELCCYVACVGYRHPFVICHYMGLGMGGGDTLIFTKMLAN